MIVPYVMLAIAVCAVWLPPVRVGIVWVHPWFVVFLAAAAWALEAGVVAPVGAIALGVVLALAWATRRTEGAVRWLLWTLAALGALALSLHVVPGFTNARWPPIRLTPDAVPFTPGLNFGKASAGLVLFALLAPHVRSVARLRPIWKPTLAIAALGAFVTVGVAVAIGYTRFEPKLPPETAAFLATNLFFTCFAEEAFFRGLLQEELHRLAERAARPALHAVAVAVSALVFGAAHAAGGTPYVLLATLSGFANALAYARARKVEASVVTHFALNAIHFVFFTYPALAR
jgi:membrane protease YdiL (CAAX protease family)